MKYKHDKITPTADLISYFRTFSDTPCTQEIAEMTNAEKTAKDILKEAFPESMFLAAMSESRYKRIDLRARKYRNILEVAVGRSPRDLIFTEDRNVQYVATDLPDSLLQHKVVIQELMRRHKLKRPNLHFMAANALCLKDLRAAADLLPQGELAIISEGFMVYLPKEEKIIFLKNVYELLKDRGGCLITSDVIFIRKDDGRSSALHEKISDRSGRDMRDNGFVDAEDAERFFRENRFSSETYLDKVDVVSIKNLHLEDNPGCRRVINYPVWVLKPIIG